MGIVSSMLDDPSNCNAKGWYHDENWIMPSLMSPYGLPNSTTSVLLITGLGFRYNSMGFIQFIYISCCKIEDIGNKANYYYYCNQNYRDKFSNNIGGSRVTIWGSGTSNTNNYGNNDSGNIAIFNEVGTMAMDALCVKTGDRVQTIGCRYKDVMYNNKFYYVEKQAASAICYTYALPSTINPANINSTPTDNNFLVDICFRTSSDSTLGGIDQIYSVKYAAIATPTSSSWSGAITSLTPVNGNFLTDLSPVNCVVSDWSSWGSCSKSCGGGTQTRTRSVTTAAANGGTACPSLTDSQSCNTQACPVESSNSFSSQGWTCIPDSGNLPVKIIDGNIACPSPDAHACLWINGCSGDVPSPMQPLMCGAMHNKIWGLDGYSDPSHWCSKAASYLKFTPPSPTPSADDECIRMAVQYGVKPNVTWGSMPSTVQPEWKTLNCDSVIDPSNICPKWASKYGIKPNVTWGSTPSNVQAEWNNLGCNNYITSTPTPVDCVVSNWSDWSSCSKSCGGGTQTRTRSITTAAANGGTACPSLSDSQSCNTQACVTPTPTVNSTPVNCVVSDWSSWGSCSKSCGGGTQTRTRSITTAAANGGTACSSLTDSQACNTQACVTPSPTSTNPLDSLDQNTMIAIGSVLAFLFCCCCILSVLMISKKSSSSSPTYYYPPPSK